jgi:hypothetical protein
MGSPPLARFTRSLGRVQHHLHTIVVGLSAVEKGIATKPDDLEITWQAHDVVGSARESRRFLLRATLIFAAEELKSYTTNVLRYRICAVDDRDLPESLAERIRASAESVDPSYLTLAPLLVSHWRNRIVHHDSRSQLTSAERQYLLSKAEHIREFYKNIDVARLLEDFESDRPTLKEVTVLLAMCIRFVRQVDSGLPQVATWNDVRRWLTAEGLLADVLRLEKEAKNGGHHEPRGRAKQYLVTKAPSLAEAYYRYGASEEK